MKNDFFNIVGDKDKIQSHILFCGTFILVYEYFISSWEQGILFLYLHCKSDIDAKLNVFHTDERFIKSKYSDFNDLQHKNKVINQSMEKAFDCLKKKSEKKCHPIFLWMLEYGFIDSSECETIEECHVLRNIYAHDLDQTLKASITQKEKDLLKSLVNIAENASQKWNDKVKGSTLSVRDAIIGMAEESGLEIPVFQTNTGKFLSIVLEHLKDITYGKTENAND